MPLVVEAHSADIIATLLILKSEVEMRIRRSLRLTITGATEAYLLAKELADSGVGVILTPARPQPRNWESRRMYYSFLSTFPRSDCSFSQTSWTTCYKGNKFVSTP